MLISAMSKRYFPTKQKMVLVLARQELYDFWSSPIGQVLEKKHWTSPLKRKSFCFHGTIAAVPIFVCF